MPQEAWPGRGPWPVPATPALVPKQGPRSLVTRSLQIQVISPGSKSPNPPRSRARRSQAPTRKGLGASERQPRCLQDLGVRRKMALTGCSWLLLSGEREWCPPEPQPPVASGKGGGLRPGEGKCEQKPSILDREGSSAPRSTVCSSRRHQRGRARDSHLDRLSGWTLEISKTRARTWASQPLLLLHSCGKPY